MEESFEILSHPVISSMHPPLLESSYDHHQHSATVHRLKALFPLPSHDAHYSMYDHDTLTTESLASEKHIMIHNHHHHHNNTVPLMEIDGHDNNQHYYQYPQYPSHYIIHPNNTHNYYHYQHSMPNNNHPSYYSTSLSTSNITCSSASASASPVVKYERSPMIESSSPIILPQNNSSMPSLLLTESIRESKKESMIESNDRISTGMNGSIFEQINSNNVDIGSSEQLSNGHSSKSSSSYDYDSDSSSTPSHSSSSSSSKKSRRSKRKSSDSSKSKKRSKVIEEDSSDHDEGSSENEKSIDFMEALNMGEELNLSKEELSQLSAEDRAEYKRLQRLQRNRASAQLSRERKKAYMRALEKQVKELSKYNSSLANQLSSLTNENELLKKKMMHNNNNSNNNDNNSDVKQALEYSSSSEELSSPPLSPESSRDGDSDDNQSRRKKKSSSISDQRNNRGYNGWIVTKQLS